MIRFFGRFNVHNFPGPQIWIAGGIGITPFLSSLRDLEMGKNQVDLFYSVQSEKDALFVDEIQSYVKKHKGFNFHLLFSNKGERITASMIAQKIKGEFKDRRLFLCGPSSMTQDLTKQAKKSGVSSIHFDKFALR